MSPGGHLLDSHVLLWLDGENRRVARTPLLSVLPRSSIFVSAATAWELGIKFASNKLDLRLPVSQMAKDYGFTELLITFKHVEIAAALPFYHRDPFDRMLVAQALVEGLILVTGDKRLAAYGVPVLLV